MSLVTREPEAPINTPQQESIPFVTEAIAQEKKEQKAILELQENRFARKNKLLFNALGMLLRHKDEIMENPSYANIDVHYILENASDFTNVRTSCEFNFCGAPVSINMRFATLLKIWNNELFKAECDCGSTAVLYKFKDSTTSGESVASAFCPCCKKKFEVTKKAPPSYYAHAINNFFMDDMTAVVKNFLAKWRLARKVFQEKIKNGQNGRKLQTTDRLYGDRDLCSLETMIQELQLKEFEEASIRT